jgi:hypothetical protein
MHGSTTVQYIVLDGAMVFRACISHTQSILCDPKIFERSLVRRCAASTGRYGQSRGSHCSAVNCILEEGPILGRAGCQSQNPVGSDASYLRGSRHPDYSANVEREGL